MVFNDSVLKWRSYVCKVNIFILKMDDVRLKKKKNDFGEINDENISDVWPQFSAFVFSVQRNTSAHMKVSKSSWNFWESPIRMRF